MIITLITQTLSGGPTRRALQLTRARVAPADTSINMDIVLLPIMSFIPQRNKKEATYKKRTVQGNASGAVPGSCCGSGNYGNETNICQWSLSFQMSTGLKETAA